MIIFGSKLAPPLNQQLHNLNYDQRPSTCRIGVYAREYVPMSLR